MQAQFKLSRRSIDQLENDIITLSEQINAKEYEFLVLLREFDLRQGWKPYHFNNCSEWLSMKCGIDVGTAREKVRVARCLFDLPQLSAAFEQGEIGYSKARALTRVMTPHNESELLDYARKATGEQVQQHCQRLRNADPQSSLKDATRLHNRRYLSRSIDKSGQMTITVQLPAETGELVMKAIDHAVAAARIDNRINSPRSPERADECNATEGTVSEIDVENPSADGSLFREQADALVDLARSYLAGGGKRSCSADHYQVMVHVDERALRRATDSGSAEKAEGAKSDLPIETVRRLCCDGAITPVVENQKGEQLNVGRKHRVVQPALKRALMSRDKCCQYPGCSHTKWLDAHYVQHWADGGETTLENTLLLCSKHHHLLHEGGYAIKHNFRGERYFESNSGRILA